MKGLTLQLRTALLLILILLAGTAAYSQITPLGDTYTNSATPTTNYGAKTLLDVESSQTTYIQFNLSSIPAGYTSADITQATLKLYVNAVTTAGQFQRGLRQRHLDREHDHREPRAGSGNHDRCQRTADCSG